jgi:SAM-dependent methyltransferase
MISARLIQIARCPDCGGRLGPAGVAGPAVTTPASLHPGESSRAATCEGCRRPFATSDGYLDLRPRTAFAEQTKYLDHDLHADARHASIAPPVLGSKIRNDMLRRFLTPGPSDRVVDLGCGNGRAIAWNASSGASIVGVDISPFFAPEALDRSDLILGDLRRLPLADGAFNKAWSLDVLEHLSPQALRDVLSEANRVLEARGALFVYTHVRRNGWPAAGVRAVNRFAGLLERAGLLDLRQERLRKSDHLNPIADHDELARVVADCGFRIERITYYSPVIGAFVENVLARLAERLLARRAGRRAAAAARQGPAGVDPREAVRAARAAAQARVQHRGAMYRLLVAVTGVMKLDLWLFGRIRSGPFFALLRKEPRLTVPPPRAASSEAQPVGG